MTRSRPVRPGGTPAARLRALVVEDEAPLARVVADYFVKDGFDVEIAGDGETAVELLQRSRPDVVVLDLMLPGIDGIETCRRIRTFSDAYVVMLTARADEVDKLVGLSAGADDYVTKPFSPRELLARVRTMLRRPRAGRRDAEPPRRFGDLTVDPPTREVRVGSRVVELTPTEFDLLDALSARPRLAFARGQLLEHVWGSRWFGDDHVVDVHVANLRRKIAGTRVVPGPPAPCRRAGTAGAERPHQRRVRARHRPGTGRGDGRRGPHRTRGEPPGDPPARPPVAAMAAAAQRIASGRYDVRVTPSGLGAEFEALGRSFDEMAAALAATERVRAELLRDAAHELRTPLATIRAYVEGLADGVVSLDADTAATLEGQLDRMQRLVDDLDKISRAEERQLDLHLVPVVLADLVATAVEAARPAFTTAGVGLAADTDPGTPRVLVDADRLHEVLANLLDNAQRHTPAGGRVTVAARRQGGEVELVVQDSGEGIPSDQLRRVFERFYRVDAGRSRTRGGSGIGLTIARALVEAHGGRIRAKSAGPGKGAAFTVTLPVAGGRDTALRR